MMPLSDAGSAESALAMESAFPVTEVVLLSAILLCLAASLCLLCWAYAQARDSRELERQVERALQASNELLAQLVVRVTPATESHLASNSEEKVRQLPIDHLNQSFQGVCIGA